MATRSSKVSQLPTANSVGPNDTFYIVQANTSMQVPASVLNLPSISTLTTGPIEGNTIITGDGTTDNTAFFTWDTSLYVGFEMTIDAVDDSDAGCRTFGTVSAAVAANIVYVNTLPLINLGDNQILLFTEDVQSGSNSTLYFARQSGTTANVIFRWKVTYFNV